MHSNIFQLERTPLREEEFVTEEEFYDGFVGIVADYVDSDIDREEEILYFINQLKPYGIIYNPEEQSIVFKEGFKEKYFLEKFNKLKQLTSELTLEEFAGIETFDELKLWKIKQLIEDKFGTYIYTENCWMPLDAFLREMEEGEKYYFGSVIDYHY
jgi:hypothetical protein